MTSLLVSDKYKTDVEMSRRALELALQGAGQVSPSPLVGCVIVSADGEIVGEGFYLYEGVKHAEAQALGQAGLRASGGTAYVSLEPHAHYGRTPPCTEAIIRAGIKRVVAPIEDPNPQVAGKGFSTLRAAGIEVVTGILAEEAEQVNERYILSLRKGRPFVHLKLACSLDGKIATREGDSHWITGEVARSRVQELRHESDAILVGAGTATTDNPVLSDRSGLPRPRPLVRIVLDSRLSLSADSQLVKTARDIPLLIFGDADQYRPAADVLRVNGVEVINDPSGGRDLSVVLKELARRSIQSVLVEGGARVAGAFMDAGLVDKFSFFIAPLIIGGERAPGAVAGAGASMLSEATRLERTLVLRHGDDIEITGYPRRDQSNG